MIRAVAVTVANVRLAADVAQMMICVWMWNLMCCESASNGCVIGNLCPRGRAVDVDVDRYHRADPTEVLVAVVVEV